MTQSKIQAYFHYQESTGFSPDKFMEFLVESWRTFAEWTAGQSLPVRLVVGSALLLAAYIVFVLVVSKLTAPPKESFRGRFRSSR